MPLLVRLPALKIKTTSTVKFGSGCSFRRKVGEGTAARSFGMLYDMGSIPQDPGRNTPLGVWFGIHLSTSQSAQYTCPFFCPFYSTSFRFVCTDWLNVCSNEVWFFNKRKQICNYCRVLDLITFKEMCNFSKYKTIKTSEEMLIITDTCTFRKFLITKETYKEDRERARLRRWQKLRESPRGHQGLSYSVDIVPVQEQLRLGVEWERNQVFVRRQYILLLSLGFWHTGLPTRTVRKMSRKIFSRAFIQKVKVTPWN